ncbi:hypothetical protein SH1V18_48250 [Vallitalea longa]|uniref:Uncharacterized protein n=1 Tax=Vallitalea longa TaxID=2936439 RepID=A0A9W5YH10_9FIRM|nr:hypothetical protein [Vallitalea longa]GKX32345.1 hypothetical protein SH1V18_48250 [Vallitalea longa]
MGKKICKVEDFKQRVLNIIREDQYLGEVNGWMDNIIYQDYKSTENAFHGTVLCASQDVNKYKLYIYDIMYMKVNEKIYIDKYELDNKEINSIIKFDRIYNKSRSYYETTKIFSCNKKVSKSKILQFP